MPQVLGIDIGGTKTAWAIVNEEGKIRQEGVYPTPSHLDPFLKSLRGLIQSHPAEAVGIGIAGTVSADHQDVVVCTNLPELSHLQLVDHLLEKGATNVTIDNDARCALIGEVWLGKAARYSSAVFLTLGTGVGGAVMQKGIIRPHPKDLNQEIGRLLVDPSDVFPWVTGSGSVEALIGGRSLEERFGINLHEEADKVHRGDKEAVELWQDISQLFLECIRMVHSTYNCKVIIIGGKGSKDLEYYLQATPPCPVIPAALGGKAGIFGAARIALDVLEEQAKDWDEVE